MSHPQAAAHPGAPAGRPPVEKPDLSEKGAPKDGAPQKLDERLFMQLLAFGGARDTSVLVRALQHSGFESVLYADLSDPQGVALLTFSKDEAHFIDTVRPFLLKEPFVSLAAKPEYAMFGRTYALGHEPNLEDWLLARQRRNALTPEWPWAVWYPVRRSGAFAKLSPDEQKGILREHGTIGHAFGEADLAHDVRLACHGLDKTDHDFVIGLLGKRLHPLSALVERMRKTTQTSSYIEHMGPFFVGKALWQSPL
ncbi:MAG: chlorite dismutase family protein [Elusimicrobia bacterium]|nr:chlorite dismutase family protein [Elusimicrobiota bacterium]